MNFVGVSESQNKIAIQDLIKVAEPAGGFATDIGVDQIWRWNHETSTWTKYFTDLFTSQWIKEEEFEATTDKVDNGETIFFYRGDNGAICDMTLSGAVRAFSASATYTVTPGLYTFVGYPWPKDLAVADMKKYMTSPSGGFAADVGVDQIWRWNTMKNDWIKYAVDLFSNEWRDVDEFGMLSDAETTAVIPVGEGFFFYRGDNGAASTIDFTIE